MNSSFFKSFFPTFLIPAIFIFFISIFFTPIILTNSNIDFTSNFIITENSFVWPTPNYTAITSYFGRRNAPTSGASTYHSGIDIAAPTGTKIISVFSGNVTYTGFSGAGRLYYNNRK